MELIKIYTLSDPRNPNNVRYVGKTKQKLNDRLRAHICDAKRRKLINHNMNWIHSLTLNGIKPLILEIDEIYCDNKEDWSQLESYWISQMKTWGFNLTNMTSGGDGNQNQVVSKETLLKKSLKLKGVKRSKEVCEKISEGKLGKKLTQTHRENVRKAIIQKQGRKICQYDIDGSFIKEWDYMKEAAVYYNVDISSLMRCCQGKFKKSAGFVWKYKN